MSIFFWLTVAAYMTTMFSAPISKNYSWESTNPDEFKEKIFAIVAIGSMFLGLYSLLSPAYWLVSNIILRCSC